MLHDLSKKLSEAVAAVENLHSALLVKQSALDGREANIIAREEAAHNKEADLHERELAVGKVEDVVAFRQENAYLATKNEEERNALAAEQLKFKKFVNEQNARIESKAKEQEAESAALVKARAELEAMKETYKQEVLADLALKAKNA